MRLGYVIIYVPDVAAAVAFYTAAFGLAPRAVHADGFAEMETGGTVLAFASEALVGATVPGFRPNRPGDAAAGIEVGLVTDDVPAAYAHAVAAGAEPLVAPAAKPWGQIVAYVRDLNGCLVELCSPMGG